MGPAVHKLTGQTTPAQRQRPSKSGTNAAHYTGNLISYRHDLVALNSLVPSCPKPAAPAPVDVESISAITKHQTFAETTIAATDTNGITLEAHPGLLQTARASLVHRAVPITGSLCLLGFVVLTWYLLDSRGTPDIQQPSTISDNTFGTALNQLDNPDLALPELVVSSTAQPAQAIVLEPAASQGPTALPGTAERTSTESVGTDTPESIEELREKIDLLQGQNTALRGHIVALKQETLGLQQDLFRREVKQLAQDAEAEETGKSNVVYQYVDIPLGASVNADLVENAESYADTPSSLNVSTSADSDGLPALPLLPAFAPPLPPISGTADSEITFDPDSELHIDPNYSTDSHVEADKNSPPWVNGLASDISTPMEYPPIPAE